MASDAPPRPPQQALAASATEVREWAEAIAKLLAVVGIPAGIAAWWRRRRGLLEQERALFHARLQRERALRDATTHAILVLLDIQRGELAHSLHGSDTPIVRRDGQAVYEHRVIQARNEMWEAAGLPKSKDETTRALVEELRKLTTTQRWNPKEADRIRNAVEKREAERRPPPNTKGT